MLQKSVNVHAFITGSGPVSLIPSGLDSTIPIEYPEFMPSDAKLFISSLLQVSRYLNIQNSCHTNNSEKYIPLAKNLDAPYYVIFKVYPGNRLGARYLAGSILCNILGVSWE